MNSLRSDCLLLLLACLVIISPISVAARSWQSTDPLGQAVSGQPGSSQDFPTNQIILKYRPQANLEELSEQALVRQVQRLSQAAGVSLSYLRPMSGEAHVLRLAERLPFNQVTEIAHRVMALPEVEYAEPDAILEIAQVPNDPQYSDQWHYFSPASGNYGINAPAAWDKTIGSAGIVAAVIDTGITNHAEFSGRTVPGYDFVSDPAIANDGDGRDNDPRDPGDWVSVEDIISGTVPPYCPIRNSSWHGTHTSGTIGAASNNGLGVTGVNWKSKILPVRVLGKCGGNLSDVVDGMRWAAGLGVPGVPGNTNPARVINVSLGGTGSCSVTAQNAVNAITAAGATVVASAGNSSADAGGFTPANCAGVITVAATDRYGDRAYYSNYGATVEIAAPGGAQSFTNDPNGVLSTLNTGSQGPSADSYAFYQGTSMSAPQVTGVVSLLYSLDPSLQPARALQILQKTATRFPVGSTCNTSTCGSGIVNAGLAVAEISVQPAIYLPVIKQ
jgi:serine protease